MEIGQSFAKNLLAYQPFVIITITILPSRFQFKFEKRSPNGVPGTSLTSLPTLTGEEMNTYIHTYNIVKADMQDQIQLMETKSILV